MSLPAYSAASRKPKPFGSAWELEHTPEDTPYGSFGNLAVRHTGEVNIIRPVNHENHNYFLYRVHQPNDRTFHELGIIVDNRYRYKAELTMSVIPDEPIMQEITVDYDQYEIMENAGLQALLYTVQMLPDVH